jgi:uncharacterized repeat protein (TIGR03847 family)
VPIRELDPLTHLVADAVGEPGRRTFFLQAASGSDQVTLLLEKEQVRQLARRLDEWLPTISPEQGDDPDELDAAQRAEMKLREPIVPDFRVGQLQLVFDPERDRVVVAARELVDDEAAEAGEGQEVHLVATRAQLRRLAVHGAQAVAAGRPACPLCGNPIDPDGHVCPAMNGHRPLTS